ncbi:MAG: AraC family transcriptional regulator [Bacteroidota bacterium]
MPILKIILSNSLNFSQGMGFVALIISLYFSFHIFFVRKNSFSRILSGYFFLFFLIQVFNFFYDIGLQNVAANLIGVFIGARLSISPMLYCYIASITNKDKTQNNLLRHLLLPIGIGIIETVLIITQHRFNDSIEFKNSISSILLVFTAFSLFVAFIIINIYYIYLSFNLLNKHRTSLGDYFTFEKGVGLKWIKTLLIGYIVYVITLFTAEIGFDDFPEWLYNIFIIIYLGFVGFKGIQQTEVFPIAKNLISEENIDTLLTENTLDEKRNAELFIRILALIENDKLYLNPDLTIVDLSFLLKINTKSISQCIKQEYKNNFSSFINSYRIDYAKNLLISKSQENITIEGIAKMSGFKSKSVFNPFFKTQTGLTPKEFKDKSLPTR